MERMSHSETGGDVYVFFLNNPNRLPNNRFLVVARDDDPFPVQFKQPLDE